jgi:hypothetical protein
VAIVVQAHSRETTGPLLFWGIYLHTPQLLSSSYYIHTHIKMLASSRTALRQAAAKQLAVKHSVRAVSVWSQVPQGPPVSE